MTRFRFERSAPYYFEVEADTYEEAEDLADKSDEKDWQVGMPYDDCEVYVYVTRPDGLDDLVDLDEWRKSYQGKEDEGGPELRL